MNNLMDLLKKTLFGVFVVLVYFFLLGTSFDLMTKANTISNLLGFIGFALLLAIGIVFVYNAVKLSIGKSEYETIKEKEWKEHVEAQMKSMQENITKHNAYSDVVKKKANPKQKERKGFDTATTFLKTRKKTNKTK